MEHRKSKLMASAAFVVIHHYLKKQKQSRKRRHWVTPMLKSRAIFGGDNLLNELHATNSGQFENFCRMPMEDFEYILGLIEPAIRKLDTNYRTAISPKERFAITLRFLATGDSFASLMYLFKVSKQSISTIVMDTCRALNNVLKDYIKMPKTSDEWLQCAKEFEKLWNFPHCLAAMDGKHVMIQAPINSGSEYYNYKSFFSIVLFVLVDANYNFLFADVGSQGRISDGGIFKNSILWRKIQQNSLNLPEPAPLPGREKVLPYVILGDEAFALHDNIMKPYSGLYEKGTKERIFNYRLSRARRVVENAFGILSSVFRVLRKPILLEPEKARDVVLTTIYLHNFLRKSKKSKHVYTPAGSIDSEENDAEAWRSEIGQSSLHDLKTVPRKCSSNAQAIRNEMADYFVTNGRICWQDDRA